MLQVYCGPVPAGRCVRCRPLLGLFGPPAAPKHVAGLHHLAWTSPGAGRKSDNRFLTRIARFQAGKAVHWSDTVLRWYIVSSSQLNRSSYTLIPDTCDVDTEYPFTWTRDTEEKNRITINVSPTAKFDNVLEHKIPFSAIFQVQIEQISILGMKNSKTWNCSGNYNNLYFDIILKISFINFLMYYFVKNYYK